MKTANNALKQHKSIGKAIYFYRFWTIAFESLLVSPFTGFIFKRTVFINKNILNNLCFMPISKVKMFCIIDF